MNKVLYTILVAAVSVGITLAFVAGCSEKCTYDDNGSPRDESAIQSDDENGYVYDDSDDDQAGSSSSKKRSSATGTGEGSGSGSATGNTPKDQPLKKYGDAETGGNVYTQGGVPPGSGKPGTTITDSIRKANSKTKAKVPGSTPGGLKTGSDGTRN